MIAKRFPGMHGPAEGAPEVFLKKMEISSTWKPDIQPFFSMVGNINWMIFTKPLQTGNGWKSPDIHPFKNWVGNLEFRNHLIETGFVVLKICLQEIHGTATSKGMTMNFIGFFYLDIFCKSNFTSFHNLCIQHHLHQPKHSSRQTSKLSNDELWISMRFHQAPRKDKT